MTAKSNTVATKKKQKGRNILNRIYNNIGFFTLACPI